MTASTPLKRYQRRSIQLLRLTHWSRGQARMPKVSIRATLASPCVTTRSDLFRYWCQTFVMIFAWHYQTFSFNLTLFPRGRHGSSQACHFSAHATACTPGDGCLFYKFILHCHSVCSHVTRHSVCSHVTHFTYTQEQSKCQPWPT